jgi:hypothetical protein
MDAAVHNIIQNGLAVASIRSGGARLDQGRRGARVDADLMS